MARTGRPRKNPALRVVKGNFGPKEIARKGKREALPSDAPLCPDHLDALEASIWDRLIEHLGRIGTLQRCDEGQLAAYCKVYARYQRADARRADDGDFYETEGRQGRVIRTHPAIGVMERCERILRSLSSEFGMSPASRKAMGYDPKQLALPFDERPGHDDPTRAYLTD